MWIDLRNKQEWSKFGEQIDIVLLLHSIKDKVNDLKSMSGRRQKGAILNW